MADVHHSDAAGEIEKFISVHIFQYAAFGARCENRCGVPNAAWDRGLPPTHPFLRFGSGYRRA
jgi:hypothetical protein